MHDLACPPAAQHRLLLLAGCRATTGGLHLGHYYGCFHKLPPAQGSVLVFIINDILGQDASRTREATQAIVEDVMTIAALLNRPVSVCRESAIRDILSPLVTDLCSVSSYRLMAEAHPHVRSLHAGRFSGTVSHFLFPITQAAYTLGLATDIACFNDDNARFVALARKLARRVNAKYSRRLRTSTRLLERSPGRLLGWDGRRMAKDYANTLSLRARFEDVAAFARKLVGRASEGALDFAQTGLSELERVYLSAIGAPEPAVSPLGKARIDYLAQQLGVFLDTLAATRSRMRADESEADRALATGEAVAIARIHQQMASAGYVSALPTTEDSTDMREAGDGG